MKDWQFFCLVGVIYLSPRVSEWVGIGVAVVMFVLCCLSAARGD